MTGRILFSLICVAQLLLCPYAHAIELWREKKNLASSFEGKHDYQHAADLYQSALKLLPASEENTKAKIEAALAMDLIALKQYDRAFRFGEDAVQIARHLKAHNGLDPDVLLSLQYLLESCTPTAAGFSGSAVRRHTLEQMLTKLTWQLRQVINPHDPGIIDNRIAYARTFVALGNEEQAQNELRAVLSEFSPKSEKYRNVKIALAAMQEKHGQKNTFASEYLRTHKPESEALRRVAEGKMWTGDYRGAAALLDRAMTKLTGTRSEKSHEEVRINRIYANLRIDRADWKGAEPYFRRNVTLMTKDPKDLEALNLAKFQLSECLKNQKRFDEAAALLSEKRNKRDKKYMERYDFMLTDEEKAELAKDEAKKGNASK